MPDTRTTITELVTGLGMLGHDDVAAAVAARPAAMRSVSPELWADLERWQGSPVWRPAFEAAFANGRAFLRAADALRGRTPVRIEWRGSARPVDDELVPADLRIDHVFLVSCKYLSRIVANVAPGRLFDGLLRVRTPSERTSWYEEVAATELAALTAAACAHTGVAPAARVASLEEHERAELSAALKGRTWPPACQERWRILCEAVSQRTAARWRASAASGDQRLRLLWRLLRIGPTPYYVLGVADDDVLRLRVLTSWDWNNRYRLEGMDIVAKPGGQPMVSWSAAVRDRDLGRIDEVNGHVEVRWSHGRLRGAPEAKVYLDTPHADVPGYLPLG